MQVYRPVKVTHKKVFVESLFCNININLNLKEYCNLNNNSNNSNDKNNVKLNLQTIDNK